LPDFHFVVVRFRGDADEAIDLSSATNTRIIDLEPNLGRGAALRAGIGVVRSPLTAFVDLSGTVFPEEIRHCALTLMHDAKIDYVIGDRWTKNNRSEAPWLRRTLSSAYSLLASILLRFDLCDVQSPVKIFRTSAVMKIFEDLSLFDAGFDAELLFRARKFKRSIVPIRWEAQTQALPLAKTALRTALSLLTVRLFNSPIKSLPFLSLLGHRYTIPVKPKYAIMLFCWRDPKNPSAGGGEVYLLEQARHWVKAGHEVTWFAQRFAGAPREERIEGIRVVRRGRFPLVFPLGALWYAFRSDRKYDFIIDCMNGIPFFTPLFSTKPKICLLYHIHSHHFKEELPGPLAVLAIAVETRLAPFIYRNTKFVTISESTRREMRDLRMTEKPIELIHCGVSEAHKPGLKSAVPTVLYVGRLKRYKQIRKLIGAFAQARQTLPDTVLKIVGDGDDAEELRAYIRSQKIENVTFLGFVDEPTKIRLMQEAWVFGMPSSIEGWGLVVIEANACGTPAIAYDVRGLRDCIIDGETGFLAPDDDTFASRLTEMLHNRELREKITKAAWEWSQNFSWEKTAEKTLTQIRMSQPWRAVFEKNTRDEWQVVSGKMEPAESESEAAM
jgi:glycosyltransferase involved in cell wall biosynthesis